MKTLFLILNDIKNNFKHIAPIVCALVLAIAYAFVLSAFFTKIFFVEMPRDRYVWAIAAASCASLVAVCMIFVYGAYFKVVSNRVKTCRLLGARRADVALMVVVEASIIYIAGVLLGSVIDSAISAYIYFPIWNVHPYMNAKVFFIGCGFAAIVPAVATNVSMLKYLCANWVFSVNK